MLQATRDIRKPVLWLGHADVQNIEIYLQRHPSVNRRPLAAVGCCRGDYHRLGHALMRCYLRYPGRAVRMGERAPEAVLEFIVSQNNVLSDAIDAYLATEPNCQLRQSRCCSLDMVTLAPPEASRHLMPLVERAIQARRQVADVTAEGPCLERQPRRRVAKEALAGQMSSKHHMSPKRGPL